MIEVASLEKRYGDFVAVEDSTFEVGAGEIVGLVGPNGAGKTTTLKVLAGLLEPSGGEARVAGRSVADHAMRRSIGYLPEESPLYEEMTPRSYLRFFADLYDVDRATADDRIARTLERLSLDRRDGRIGDLSKGMRRKVAIARSLINDPAVLIYDEPASGLDPLTTNVVIEFIGELADDGKTVLLSAHNLFHVERICDRVLIMADGRIVTRGTVPEIRRAHGRTEYHVETTVAVPGSEAVDGVYRSVVEDMAAVEAIREAAEEAGGEVSDIRTREASLEEIFIDVAQGGGS